MAKEKHAGGRPSLYQPGYCDKVLELGRGGKSKAQMCAAFDISRQTIDNWAEQREEFLDALTRAEMHAQAYWEQKGEDNLATPGFSAQIWKKTMEARFRKDYTERQEVGGLDGGIIRLTIASSDADL